MTTIRLPMLHLLTACLAVAACTDDSSTQVLTGRIDSTKNALAIRAVAEGDVITATPVRSDGSFTLSLPSGSSYRLEVLTRTGVKNVVKRSGNVLRDLQMKVCDAGNPFDMGGVGDPNTDGLCGPNDPSCTPCDPAAGMDCTDPCTANPMDPGCWPDPCSDPSAPGCKPPPTCEDPMSPNCHPTMCEDPTDPNCQPPSCDPMDPGCTPPGGGGCELQADGTCCPPDDPMCVTCYPGDPNCCDAMLDPSCAPQPCDPAIDPWCKCHADGTCPPTCDPMLDPMCGDCSDPSTPGCSPPCSDPMDPNTCNDPCMNDPMTCGCTAPGCWPEPEPCNPDANGMCNPTDGWEPDNVPGDFGC